MPEDSCDPLAARRIVSSSSGVGGNGRPGPFRCCSSRRGFGTGSLTWGRFYEISFVRKLPIAVYKNVFGQLLTLALVRNFTINFCV
jgi:hypothetical protein